MGRHGIQAPSPIQTAGRFTRTNQKTLEEKEATRYETPADSEKQSIDEELGIQDVTNINEDWYPPPESELAAAVKDLLDSQQPMEVDEAPEERPYQMFDEEAPDVSGLDPGPGSLVSATKDIIFDNPGGPRRWKTNHWICSRLLRSKDYGTHHRRVDAQKKTVCTEVPQMKNEDQSFIKDLPKFDVISSK